MVLATFENVLVAVEGMPDGSTVSLGVADEGLSVGGFGMLAWRDAVVRVDDLSPRGVRVRVTPPAGAPSTFFIPSIAIPEGLPPRILSGSIERLAAGAGALVEGSLTAA